LVAASRGRHNDGNQAEAWLLEKPRDPCNQSTYVGARRVAQPLVRNLPSGRLQS